MNNSHNQDSQQAADAKSKEAFKKLPQGVRDWLSSDDVFGIITGLNNRFELVSVECTVIPRLITRVILKMTPPENFSKELSSYLPLLSDSSVATATQEIHDRIFKPIRHLLKPLEINFENLLRTQQPAVRTMKIEQPVARPQAPAPIAPRPVAPPPPPQPRARTMEIKGGGFAPQRPGAGKVIDVRPPQQPGGAPPVPKAQEMKMERATTPHAPLPPSTTPASISPKPAAPVDRAEKIEPPKPIGLSEVVPQPTKHEELEPYEDHHPERKD